MRFFKQQPPRRMSAINKNIRVVLGSTGGESLLESIISILIFTVLVASVTMILTVSLGLTAHSFEEAQARQDAVNAVVMDPGGTPAVVAFRVYLREETGDTPLSPTLNRNVLVRTQLGITAFAPPPGDSTQ